MLKSIYFTFIIEWKLLDHNILINNALRNKLSKQGKLRKHCETSKQVEFYKNILSEKLAFLSDTDFSETAKSLESKAVTVTLHQCCHGGTKT